jgi:putative flippase GtrA
MKSMKLITISTNASRLDHRRQARYASWLKLDWVNDAMRYFAASGVALAVDFAFYILLIRIAGIDYLIGATCGFTLGLITIYLLSIKFVFGKRRVTNTFTEFIVFAGIGVCGLLINNFILYIAIDIFYFGYEISKMMSAVCVFCFNFVLRKMVLFNKKAD